MKTEMIIACIKRAAGSYRELEIAKADCEEAVDAEIDLLVSECSEKITAADKKCIKKIAKSIASEKVDSLKREAKDLAEILASMTTDGSDEE